MSNQQLLHLPSVHMHPWSPPSCKSSEKPLKVCSWGMQSRYNGQWCTQSMLFPGAVSTLCTLSISSLLPACLLTHPPGMPACILEPYDSKGGWEAQNHMPLWEARHQFAPLRLSRELRAQEALLPPPNYRSVTYNCKGTHVWATHTATACKLSWVCLWASGWL